jgi:hypothetical protein
MKLKSADLTAEHVGQLVTALQIPIAPEGIAPLVEVLKSNDEDKLAEYLSRPGSIEKFGAAISNQQPITTLIVCPHCDNAAVYDQREIPQLNPKVVCRSEDCGLVINL